MATQPRVPLAISNEGARVLIVKFNDYQCPACGQSYLAYKPILAKYALSHPGAVKVVMKDYPLSPQCNSSMQSELHGGACQAAVAVRLAREHNREVQMEEWLYTHQNEMTPDKVKQMAREIGQVTDFDARYAATLELVKGDISLAQTLKISSTPTFFINGVKVEGAWQPQFFDQAIAFELKRGQ
jgi:protein-disulfide isomerase